MKFFEKPVIEVATFSIEDVITESVGNDLTPPCVEI